MKDTIILLQLSYILITRLALLVVSIVCYAVYFISKPTDHTWLLGMGLFFNSASLFMGTVVGNKTEKSSN